MKMLAAISSTLDKIVSYGEIVKIAIETLSFASEKIKNLTPKTTTENGNSQPENTETESA